MTDRNKKDTFWTKKILLYTKITYESDNMSQRIVLSLPDEHYNWLDEVRKRRGWETVQAAIRSLIEDSFRLEQKLGAGKVDEPVPLKLTGVDRKGKAVVHT